MHDIPFDLLLGLASLVYVFNNFVANIMAKQWSSVEKQVLAWVAGVVALMLAAHTDFAGGYTVANRSLDTLSWSSLVFLGLLPPSFGGVLYHLGQRFDNTGSGAVPALPAPPAPAVTVHEVNDPSDPLNRFAEPIEATRLTPPEPQVIHLQPVINVHLPEAPKPAPKRRASTRTSTRQ